MVSANNSHAAANAGHIQIGLVAVLQSDITAYASRSECCGVQYLELNLKNCAADLGGRITDKCAQVF